VRETTNCRSMSPRATRLREREHRMMRKPNCRLAVARREVATVDQTLALCMLAVCTIVTIYALRPNQSPSCAFAASRPASCGTVSGK
jgi:hypothetical protein